MAHDFQFEPGQSFGKWLHREIQEAVAFEDAAWAIDRVRRVEERLQAGRAHSDRLIVEIPWMEEATAFTAPGRYIYFSRRLYELCGSDEESDDELDANARWTMKAQIWAWQRKRGHLPIRDRRQMLRKHLRSRSGRGKQRGAQSPVPGHGAPPGGLRRSRG